MARLYTDRDRYGVAPAAVLVEATNEAIRDVLRGRVEAFSEAPFSEVVFGAFDALVTADDIDAVERRILATGHRFAWSSALSVRDRPEIYAGDGDSADEDFSFEHDGAAVLAPEADGRQQRGIGDNVRQVAGNTVGRAMHVRSSNKVLELMRDGVPETTIAVIDDAGGTLTAPILDRFAGVICAGGTVRSHLGILTREYGIPCIMNARISGIRDGDRVEIESSAAARTAESYATGLEMPARVWKLA
jgi:phosphohistidine swiveling domain-containing protein